jgi:hypothetical protein
MKRIVSFLTIGFLAVTWGQAQIPLRGIITVHNSRENTGKIEYVSGAQVDCPAAQPTQSDIDGLFVLAVSGLQKGNRVAVYVFPPLECYRGYVVVNEKSLKEETVLGTDSIRVSICPADELDRRKAEILDINMDNYTVCGMVLCIPCNLQGRPHNPPGRPQTGWRFPTMHKTVPCTV